MKIRFIPILLFSFLVTPLYAGGYFVFHSYGGTVDNYNNDTAIAIRYEYDGPSPLKKALIKFFDGPTDFEKETTGAQTPFKCSYDGVSFFKCGASEVFKSVKIKNNTAYIELAGVPAAAASGEWMAFSVPFSLTVKQFPKVSDFMYVVHGVEFKYGGEGCSEMCFLLLENTQQVKNWKNSNY